MLPFLLLVFICMVSGDVLLYLILYVIIFFKLVRYHSGGFGINPYIFECGEVRFNLIKGFTWSGQTLRVSESTTMLQLLLTIQDRVLNADPLFHQPRFLDSGPSVAAEYMSLLYNEDILIKSLETMIYTMNKPPKVRFFCSY